MKKVLGFGIPILIVIVVCTVFVTSFAARRAERDDYFKRTDAVFRDNFSILCNNLNQAESEAVNQENEKRAFLCFSIFSLTSFSGNADMNQLVLTLCQLSEEKQLYDVLDRETIAGLNRLCVDIQNDALIEQIVASIRETNCQ